MPLLSPLQDFVVLRSVTRTTCFSTIEKNLLFMQLMHISDASRITPPVYTRTRFLRHHSLFGWVYINPMVQDAIQLFQKPGRCPI